MIENEPLIRLGIFGGIFGAMVLWEFLLPRRRQSQERARRWLNNLAVAVINAGVVRVLFPAAAVGFAFFAEARGWGLFHWVEAPWWLAVVLSFLVLDLVIYAQHVVFHHVPLLWRLHRMHHADTSIDVTTALRFHPVEIVLSMGLKFCVIVALGAPALAVLIFEVVLNGTALFNHSNIRMPAAVDRVLRLVLVTPDMHRVHHSVHRRETNSNFGFNMPWWDRLFGTYRAQPVDGHDGMTIGLHEFRDPREGWLDRLLLQPLRQQGGQQRGQD